VSQLIVGIHAGYHDSAAVVFEDYTLKAAIQLERLTRIKGDASVFPHRCIDEVLSIAGAARSDVGAVAISRMHFPNETFINGSGLGWLWGTYRKYLRGKSTRTLAREIRIMRADKPEDVIDGREALKFAGLTGASAIHFYDHHEAHALPALFYTDWDDALVVTADGAGDNVNYSHRHFANGTLTTLYGGKDSWHTLLPPDSLARLYYAVTETLGFRPNRHEGKITGLAAMGEPILYDRIAPHFQVDEAGRIRTDFRRMRDMHKLLRIISDGVNREDVAASVQKVVEDTMLLSVRRMLDRHPARRLGVSGGLFANVKLNQSLAERLPIDEFFVFPPMGDEGLPIGGVLSYLLQRDGMERWLHERRRLDNVYLGRDYGLAIDRTLRSSAGITVHEGRPVDETVRRLAAGEIGAVYTGRMEYGPRALGARSILASPARRATHDILNQRLERTEFMPFAPVVAAAKAADIFEINAISSYACRFMTITCNVRHNWRERIPAVVHVDGTARPQTITREGNPLYFDLIEGFERMTGIPVLVNTSFNVHEEPIVNTPEDCAKALIDGRIDFVATERGLYEKPMRSSQTNSQI
jgi:carbamoyltransferase